jgi:hypothetical protein
MGAVRKAAAVAVVFALQGAALSAPFVHAHPDDHATEHHAGRTVHTHWAAHAHPQRSSDEPMFAADDHDRAVFLKAFLAVASAVLSVPAVADDPVELAVPPERSAHRNVEVVHSHDPPVFNSLSPRAPPTFLS